MIDGKVSLIFFMELIVALSSKLWHIQGSLSISIVCSWTIEMGYQLKKQIFEKLNIAEDFMKC